MGEPIAWQELPGRRASKVCIFNEGTIQPRALSNPESLGWMLQKMDRFRVFAPRVRERSFSPASEGPDEPDGEVGGEAAIEP